ncbi:signal peptide peptidase SppA [Lentisphaera marina]|uniref:signal peptide peptidase SppA n=1 Tax=Lentisphaera marina TaxID=1111041 RepID=UPI0023659A55|nr:signal peptide peptidase SppA [Lentisphaera marina]MDD7985512.1 signal peptide peptidase SppA [Lentisphaera marina]
MRFLLALLFFCVPAFSKDLIAVYRLGHVMGETLPEPGINEILDPEKVRPLNFMQILSCLNYCVSKEEVKAVVLYSEGMRLGMAQKQELLRRIHEIKKAGKEVYLYAFNLDESTLPLAQSTKISLFPEGDVSFRGLAMQQLYFKGLLDKLGLEADIIHIGDYKSAGEPFYLTAPSAEAAKQQKDLGEGLFLEVTKECAKGGRKDQAAYHALIDEGLFLSQQALEHKLVDKLEYHNEFVKRLKGTHAKADFKLNYGMPKSFEPPKINNMMDALSFFQKLSAPKKKSNNDILALVNLDGTIDARMGEQLRRYIMRASQNDQVKAMVLRINSPGGSALASEMICQATEEFKKTGKTFVVSMGNVAASGGYYSAVFGEPIFAESATITGSIGVLGGKLVMSKMLDKIGISTHEFKIGKYSDINSSTSFFNEEQRNKITESMNHVYAVFKDRINQGRKSKLTGDLEAMAGGRVYTGLQAKELGLVDKIGGLREAINEAKKQAGLKRYSLETFPKQLTFEEMLMESFRPQEKEDEFVSYEPMMKKSLNSEWLTELMLNMKIHQPKLTHEIHKFFQYLTLLQGESTLVLDPRWAR